MTASNIPKHYRRLSTLWFYGQFLAWIEIVRREVQVIDVGDVRRTAQLQRHLFDVVDIMATDSIADARFRVFRADQRAIGEAMVTERSTGERRRSDSMGYADFVQRFEGDRAFARWFLSLDNDIQALMAGTAPGARLALTQRTLIDLIDFIDPEWIRFPDANERGKLPAPARIVDRKRRRPPTEAARFRFEGDPFAVLRSWAKEHGCHASEDRREARAILPRRLSRRRHEVVLVTSPPWVELHVVAAGRQLGDDPIAEDTQPSVSLSVRELDALNSLLGRFDRPTLPRRNRRLPLA
jgi:hypothetical protein